MPDSPAHDVGLALARRGRRNFAPGRGVPGRTVEFRFGEGWAWGRRVDGPGSAILDKEDGDGDKLDEAGDRVGAMAGPRGLGGGRRRARGRPGRGPGVERPL